MPHEKDLLSRKVLKGKGSRGRRRGEEKDGPLTAAEKGGRAEYPAEGDCYIYTFVRGRSNSRPGVQLRGTGGGGGERKQKKTVQKRGKRLLILVREKGLSAGPALNERARMEKRTADVMKGSYSSPERSTISRHAHRRGELASHCLCFEEGGSGGNYFHHKRMFAIQ